MIWYLYTYYCEMITTSQSSYHLSLYIITIFFSVLRSFKIYSWQLSDINVILLTMVTVLYVIHHLFIECLQGPNTILELKRGESIMTIIDLTHTSNHYSNHLLVGVASLDWGGGSGSSHSSC